MGSKTRQKARVVRDWLDGSVLDHWLVRDWYWRLRRRLYPRTRRRFGDVTAEFSVTQPQDLVYHEFDSESPVLEDLLSELAADDVFYDIGANIGLYACVVAQALGPGNVVAFEPSPPAYDLLRRNVALNGDRIRTYRVALRGLHSRAVRRARRKRVPESGPAGLRFAAIDPDGTVRLRNTLTGGTVTRRPDDVVYRRYKATAPGLDPGVEADNTQPLLRLGMNE